jgi:hypothetical protein
MIRKLIAVFFFVASAFFGQAQTAPQLSSVPAARLAHIRHGINLSGWFAQVYDPKGYTKEHFQTWITAPDIALIKAMGFDHVRLSVNPQPFMDAARRGAKDEYSGGDALQLDLPVDAGWRWRKSANRWHEK